MNKKVNPVAVLVFLVSLAFYIAAAKAGHHGGSTHGFFSGG